MSFSENHQMVFLLQKPFHIDQPDALEQFRQLFQKGSLLASRTHKGNAGRLILLAPATDQVLTISLWEEEAHRQAGETSGDLQERLARRRHLFTSLPIVENYEIALRE